MSEAEAARLKLLEQENAQLKKIVANQALDIQMLPTGISQTRESSSGGSSAACTAASVCHPLDPRRWQTDEASAGSD